MVFDVDDKKYVEIVKAKWHYKIFKPNLTDH